MWLLTTFLTALIVTLLYLFLKKKYQLGFLSLLLWGATIMILVDHFLNYEGGQFLETETDGLIQGSSLLGLVMLIPVFLIWGIALILEKRKSKK